MNVELPAHLYESGIRGHNREQDHHYQKSHQAGGGFGRFFFQIAAITPGTNKGRAQIGKNDRRKGIDLGFQYRGEGASPNHFHGHGAKTGGEQNSPNLPAAVLVRQRQFQWRRGSRFFAWLAGRTLLSPTLPAGD